MCKTCVAFRLLFDSPLKKMLKNPHLLPEKLLKIYSLNTAADFKNSRNSMLTSRYFLQRSIANLSRILLEMPFEKSPLNSSKSTWKIYCHNITSASRRVFQRSIPINTQKVIKTTKNTFKKLYLRLKFTPRRSTSCIHIFFERYFKTIPKTIPILFKFFHQILP